MLISTSRKPNQKTRTFCKNLSNALGFPYVNRGKMSMRDLLLKSSQSNHDSIAIVYEKKGNPSKITFFSGDDEEELAILVSVSLSKDRLNINTEDIKIKCECQELAILSEILGFENSYDVETNYIHVQKLDSDGIAIVNFYNNSGVKTGLRIKVKKILPKT